MGVGGHVAFLPRYGPVGFGHVEAFREVRTRSGFDVLLGLGLGRVMTTSRAYTTPPPACTGECSDDRFHRGEGSTYFRVELGYAF